MENKLIFNNKEYELVETQYPEWVVWDELGKYADVGWVSLSEYEIPKTYLKSLRIKDKFYMLKLIENEQP